MLDWELGEEGGKGKREKGEGKGKGRWSVVVVDWLVSWSRMKLACFAYFCIRVKQTFHHNFLNCRSHHHDPSIFRRNRFSLLALAIFSHSQPSFWAAQSACVRAYANTGMARSKKEESVVFGQDKAAIGCRNQYSEPVFGTIQETLGSRAPVEGGKGKAMWAG